MPLDSETSGASDGGADATYTKKDRPSHPPYVDMVVEAIREQHSRKGVSRAKVVLYIKSKYKLEEVSGAALKKAVQTAETNERIEHKTGIGMSGSYVLTKKEKMGPKKVKKPEDTEATSEKVVKADAKSTKEKAKPDSKSTKEKAKPDAKSTKEKVVQPKVKSSKDTVVVKKAKKAPVPKGPKGKENTPKWKKGDPVRKPKILQAKVALTKAKISRDLSAAEPDEPVASTSKKREASKKK